MHRTLLRLDVGSVMASVMTLYYYEKWSVFIGFACNAFVSCQNSQVGEVLYGISIKGWSDGTNRQTARVGQWWQFRVLFFEDCFTELQWVRQSSELDAGHTAECQDHQIAAHSEQVVVEQIFSSQGADEGEKSRHGKWKRSFPWHQKCWSKRYLCLWRGFWHAFQCPGHVGPRQLLCCECKLFRQVCPQNNRWTPNVPCQSCSWCDICLPSWRFASHNATKETIKQHILVWRRTIWLSFRVYTRIRGVHHLWQPKGVPLLSHHIQYTVRPLANGL